MNKKLQMQDTKFLYKCDKRDLEIIQARYDGESLDTIKEKFGYQDKISVANLFSPTGRLRSAYDEYRDILHQAFLDETVNLMKKSISPAIKILIKNMASQNGNISNSAAKYLLDREFGTAKQSVEHTGEMPLQIIIKAPEREQDVIDG